MSTYILVAGDAGISNILETARSVESDASAVHALVAGPREVAQSVAGAGVTTTWLGEGTAEFPEAAAPQIAQLVADAAPEVVLASTRPADRALLGAVAAKLGAPVLTMASEVSVADGAATVTHAVHGGVAQRTVRVGGTVLLALDGGSAPEGTGEVQEAAPGEPLTGVTVLETATPERVGVDLGKATKVVAVGRGLKAQDDLKIIEELAQGLGAEVACSRPLAEGLDWFTHDRYVGVTGQHIAPELYVAVGISGQLQHTVGARDAKTVVVVNSDKDAPYTKEADYVIVGDLYEIVPALTAALN